MMWRIVLSLLCIAKAERVSIHSEASAGTFEKLWAAAKKYIDTTGGGLYDSSVKGYAGTNGDATPRGLTACKTTSDYKVAPKTAAWQCAQDKNTNFGDAKTSYQPSDGVLASLAAFASIDVAELKQLNIGSFASTDATADASMNGKWCGMPGPPNDNVNHFWDNCVKSNGGYFNVAYCDDNNQYAVLGFAAINPGVCYPVHHHNNEEEYWQIGGNSTWKAWMNGNQAAGTVFHGESGVKRIHYAGTPHEMQTENGFMLSVYWWAMDQSKGAINYLWGSEIKDSCMYNPDQQKCFSSNHA